LIITIDYKYFQNKINMKYFLDFSFELTVIKVTF